MKLVTAPPVFGDREPDQHMHSAAASNDRGQGTDFALHTGVSSVGSLTDVWSI